jgi:hypothetical protein
VTLLAYLSLPSCGVLLFVVTRWLIDRKRTRP